MKSIKRTISKKLYWASKTQAERSEHASMMVKAKHAKLTPRQRSENARKLALIRWSKKF